MKKIDISLRHIGVGGGRFGIQARKFDYTYDGIQLPETRKVLINIYLWKWFLAIRDHTPGWKRPFLDLKWGQNQLKNRRAMLAEFAEGTGTWWVTTDITFGLGPVYGPFDSEIEALLAHDGSTFQVRKGVILCKRCGYALGPNGYCHLCNQTKEERVDDLR